MLKITQIALAAALAIAPSIQAKADSDMSPLWSTIGGWAVRYDSSVKGCFAIQRYTDETMIRIGVDRVNGNVYLMYGNLNWRELEVGKVYHLQFIFDGGLSEYEGDLKVIKIGTTTTLQHSNLSEAFLRDFAQRQSMHIVNRQGQKIARLSLTNTAAAIIAVSECQEEMDSHKS